MRSVGDKSTATMCLYVFIVENRISHHVSLCLYRRKSNQPLCVFMSLLSKTKSATMCLYVFIVENRISPYVSLCLYRQKNESAPMCLYVFIVENRISPYVSLCLYRRKSNQPLCVFMSLSSKKICENLWGLWDIIPLPPYVFIVKKKSRNKIRGLSGRRCENCAFCGTAEAFRPFAV